MYGVPVTDEKLAEFRAKFLYSGNASASGRELDIPERTARQIAAKLEEDESFAEERRALRARVLDRHVAMRLRVSEKALERFEDDDHGIDVKKFGEGGPVQITDKRADYGKLVLEAEKNAQALSRFDAKKTGTMPESGPAVVINMPPEAPPSGAQV